MIVQITIILSLLFGLSSYADTVFCPILFPAQEASKLTRERKLIAAFQVYKEKGIPLNLKSFKRRNSEMDRRLASLGFDHFSFYDEVIRRYVSFSKAEIALGLAVALAPKIEKDETTHIEEAIDSSEPEKDEIRPNKVIEDYSWNNTVASKTLWNILKDGYLPYGYALIEAPTEFQKTISNATGDSKATSRNLYYYMYKISGGDLSGYYSKAGIRRSEVVFLYSKSRAMTTYTLDEIVTAILKNGKNNLKKIALSTPEGSIVVADLVYAEAPADLKNYVFTIFNKLTNEPHTSAEDLKYGCRVAMGNDFSDHTFELAVDFITRNRSLIGNLELNLLWKD